MMLSNYMKYGLKVAIVLTLIVVGIVMWQPTIGLFLLAAVAYWFWTRPSPENIDADLHIHSNDEIEKELEQHIVPDDAARPSIP